MCLLRLKFILVSLVVIGLSVVSSAGSAQSLDSTADFSFSPSSPKSGEIIQFTDTSTGKVFGWFWNFGDEATSGTQSPAHAFAQAGVYSVTLTVIDSNLSQLTASHTVSISAGGTTTAEFSFDPVTPIVGQSVSFADLSTGSPTSWSWDFGDGAKSTQQNPSHTYSAAGSKKVALTATANSTPSSVTKTIQVQASALAANFAYFPTNPVIGQVVTFEDVSKGNPSTWSWVFGDGGTSLSQNPSHTYTTPGTFTVNLAISGSGATDSATKRVTVASAPVGAFTAKLNRFSELNGPTANGNGKAEPGERISALVSISNGTSRTEPAVVGKLIPLTPGVTMIVDQVEYGNVATGASAAAPGVPFEFSADASLACGAPLSFDLQLAYGGQPVVDLPLIATLGSSPCAPPKSITSAIGLEDGPMEGASYAIGSGVAVSFSGSSSESISGYKIELSRDAGVTWELLSDGEIAYVGPHLYLFTAAGPATSNARIRVTGRLANGATFGAVSRKSFSIVQGIAGATTSHLPVVVQSPGLQQTYFTTEATIASPDRAAAVSLTFTPVGGVPVTLPKPVGILRGSRFFPDIFQPFRDQGILLSGPSLVGTLTASAGGVPNLVIAARVVNVPSSGIGTFGLSYLSRKEGSAVATEAWVTFLETNSQFRSNISLAHAGGGSHGALGLSLELYDASTGQQVSGSPLPVVLSPDGFVQINNFQGFGASRSGLYLLRVVRTSGNDQFRVYGTVIDNVSGDGSFVDGASPYPDGAAAVRLASVVEAAGLFGSFFTSDIVIANRSASQTAQVSLHLETTNQGAFDIPDALELAPRRAVTVSGIVQYFRDHGASLTGTVVGPLTVSFSNGDGSVAVRTGSSRVKGNPSSGTFGLSFAGRRVDQEAAGSVLLIGAKKSSAYRTNLSLVNQGSAPVTLSYQLVTSAFYNTSTPVPVVLAPGAFFQVNDVVGAVGGASGDYFVLVTRTAGTDPWEAYLTILDNVTNDGSFVEMVKP